MFPNALGFILPLLTTASRKYMNATWFDLIECKGVVLFLFLRVYRQYIGGIIVNISKCDFQRFYKSLIDTNSNSWH